MSTSQLRAGGRMPPILCGRCGQLVAEMTRTVVGAEMTGRSVREVVLVRHAPCGCSWDGRHNQEHVLLQTDEAPEAMPAACAVCGVLGEVGCPHVDLIASVDVPIGTLLAGWPDWHRQGPGRYWVTRVRRGSAHRYLLWRSGAVDGAITERAVVAPSTA